LGDLVSIVSTVKFGLHEDVQELQARIYLDTKRRLSKKEVLEIVFQVGAKNYDQILEKVRIKEQKLDEETIEAILELPEDYGEGSEELSSKIDEVVYKKKDEE